MAFLVAGMMVKPLRWRVWAQWRVVSKSLLVFLEHNKMHLNLWSLKRGLRILHKQSLSWDLWHFLIPRRPELPQKESFLQYFGLLAFHSGKNCCTGTPRLPPKKAAHFFLGPSEDPAWVQSWIWWEVLCIYTVSPPLTYKMFPMSYHSLICSHMLNSMTRYNLKL